MWTKLILQVASIIGVFFYMYQAHRSKNFKKRNLLFYASTYFILIFLFSYPVELPMSLGFAFLSWFAMGAMLYHIWRRTVDASFVFFVAVFATLGCIFFVQDMSERGWGLFKNFYVAKTSVFSHR